MMPMIIAKTLISLSLSLCMPKTIAVSGVMFLGTFYTRLIRSDGPYLDFLHHYDPSIKLAMMISTNFFHKKSYQQPIVRARQVIGT